MPVYIFSCFTVTWADRKECHEQAYCVISSRFPFHTVFTYEFILSVLLALVVVCVSVATKPSQDGRTALDLVKEGGRSEILALLQVYGRGNFN